MQSHMWEEGSLELAKMGMCPDCGKKLMTIGTRYVCETPTWLRLMKKKKPHFVCSIETFNRLTTTP